ncbi:LysE family translocator [Planomonospora alba]|uniref:LysE family translocator n=1 Tax=Planomonospora alba TaxID=161354 RepID=A0ABP6MJ33_9ACTN
MGTVDIITALASFAVVAGLLTVTPGVDTALVLRTSLLAGRRSAWGVVLGIQAGTLLWGVLSAAGVSAVLAASRLAYDVLRWAGAAYLLWLGARMLWESRRTDGAAAAPPEAAAGGFLPGLRRGVVTNLLNPKVGVFYVAMIPQFMPDGVPHAVMGLLLAGVHVCEGLLWSLLLVGFTALLRGWLNRPAVRRGLDRLTGVVVVGFGVRLAVQD